MLLFSFDLTTFTGIISLLGLAVAFVVVASLAMKYGHFKGCKKSYISCNDLTDKDHMYCKKLDQLDHDMAEARKQRKHQEKLTNIFLTFAKWLRTGVPITKERYKEIEDLFNDDRYDNSMSGIRERLLIAMRGMVLDPVYSEMSKLDAEVAISEILRHAKFVKAGNGQLLENIELTNNGNKEDRRMVDIKVRVTTK